MTDSGTDLPEQSVVNTVFGEVSGFLVQAGRIGGGVHYHHYSTARSKVELPYRSGAIPPQAASFQRRASPDSVLTIDETFKTTVLSGLGGVGKTQLAVDYTECAWTAGDIDLLVWIPAGSRDAIVSAYAQVAIDVTGVDDADPDQGARRLLDWLGSTSARWLVVLDDVQSPGDLVGLWPPTAVTGRVVVTTRRRDTALRGYGRRIVDVGTFVQTEAMAYLTDVVGERTHLLDGAGELAAALGYLPLALAQAAAYLLDRDLSCAVYLERLTDRRRKLATVLPEGEALPDSHRATVAATWSISLEHASRLDPAGLASPLIEIAALLNADGIPVELFGAPTVVRYLSERAGREVGAEEARDGLGCLHRLSLATVDGPVVRVHALIQRATRDDLAPQHLPALVGAAADALVLLWPEVESEAQLVQVLRANADALAVTGEHHLWRDGGHEVLLRAAQSLGESGLAATAADRFRHLCTEAARHLGPDHPDTLSTRANAAHWHGETGDSAGAVRAMEELLADAVRVLGPDHPDVLGTRNDLALWRARAGDPVAAVRAFEELLPRQMTVLGADHRSTLVTRANLATWSRHAGDPARALTALDELVTDQMRVLGASHPVTLATRVNLASARAEQDDASGTLSAFEELLPDLVRVFGAGHPTTLAARQAFASARGKIGDPAGAAAAFEDLLADQLRTLGPDHPHTLITRHDIAHWTGEAGDPASAVCMSEELLPDLLRVLGTDHPHVLACRHVMASMRGAAGDPAGALTAFEQLLQDQVRVFGTDHPTTLDFRGTVALWRKETGDLAGAITALEDLQHDQLRVLGSDHPTTLVTRVGTAAWRAQAGDLTGAVSALEALLPDQTRVLGQDHTDTFTTRGLVAAWRAEMGDLAGAIGWGEALLHDRARVLGADDLSTLSTLRNIAGWRREVGDQPGALIVLQELLPREIRTLGVDHPDTLSTRLVAAYLRGEEGDTAKALDELEELLPDLRRALGAEHTDSETAQHLITLYRRRLRL